MTIDKDILIKASFALGSCLIIRGIIFSIGDEAKAFFYLILGVIFSIIFIVMAVYEVNSSTRISKVEKRFWITGLIISGTLVGLMYLLSARKRIVPIS